MSVPHKVWRKLFQNHFMEETIYVHRALTSDHSKGEGVSHIHFLVIIFHFTNYEGKVFTLEDRALTKTMEIFILEVNG